MAILAFFLFFSEEETEKVIISSVSLYSTAYNPFASP